MTQSINELEREIEETRARLDVTIDQIQNRLSTSGVVDEVLGSVKRTQFAAVMDETLAAVRRNPVPVLLMVAGLGLLFHRMSEEARVRRYRAAYPLDDEPVVRTRAHRGYDPDYTPPHTPSDTLEPRRAHVARA